MVVDNPIFVGVPLHIVWDAGVAMTTGVGWTVTSKLNGIPGQIVIPGPVGVITYLTTPGEVPVFINGSLIRLPQPEVQSLKSVIVPFAGEINTEAVQVNVVPDVAEVMV